MAGEHLGDRLARLRRMADLTQERLAERAGVSVDVVRKLEQRRKHSARLPTLHALARGLGVELTALLGDPPGVPSTGEVDPPQLVAIRRAILPPMFAVPPDPSGPERLSLPLVLAEITQAWTLYHAAGFGRLMDLLPGLIDDARFVATVGTSGERAAGQAALAKVLQLGGHLAIRLGKSDLAISALERAIRAAEASSDPLLAPMICNSVAWAYQRQNRLDDAGRLAVWAADTVEREGALSAESVRVRGSLLMSAATSAARGGDYDRARDMMGTSEHLAGSLTALPPPVNGKLVSVFSRSSVRIERVRLAVQHARPEEALTLARGLRLSRDTPVSWRTWLLLDVARAHADLGDATRAVKTLESLRRAAPGWMRHHTLAVAVVSDLWAGPVRPPGLRKLATELGVAG
ncbi:MULTISPECIES: helix-turn-helix domain-containing protein [Streptomyces]|jgi:transcriptional regulator with XRE-family HTH domain|uniref:helix-turn-helix domain-containing protein n=1 Tax=Streptomyces TaxID=1883 RepID=UPI0019084AD3|nr:MULTISPECIES: helix-turn-helix transcriptional regulator [unclassified Streptomyces]MCU4747743.1 helix-turn-helix domain-containing protein [Streptomyces sp. G-5]QQN78369.1 helix-turn-helix transcriptional regulator [Streptomyces sp. XC 2026]